MVDGERQERTLQNFAIGSIIGILWLVSAIASLVSSPDYGLPLAVAFSAQLGLILLVRPYFRRSGLLGRVLWGLFLIPMAVFFVDNVGRVLAMLDLPYFRILI